MQNDFKYIDLNLLFKKPYITSYGFTKLLMAKLYLRLHIAFNESKLVELLYDLSYKYNKLFCQIGFRISLNFIYSSEISNAISQLVDYGYVYRNPHNTDYIILTIGPKITNDIIKQYSKEINDIMDLLVNDLIKMFNR